MQTSIFSNKFVNVANIVRKLRQISNEWNQEGNYCLIHLKNENRAEVWFTVSEYLNNLSDEIETEEMEY